jgi:hypothetical protein
LPVPACGNNRAELFVKFETSRHLVAGNDTAIACATDAGWDGIRLSVPACGHNRAELFVKLGSSVHLEVGAA